MQLRKTIVIALCSIIAVFAACSMALAAPSPTLVRTDTVYATSPTGEKVGFWIEYTGQPGWIIVEPSDKAAENVASGVEPFASFKAYESTPGAVVDEQGRIPGGLLLNFDVGEKYAGYKATIYIEHDYGANEVKTVTVSAKGIASTNIDRLSTFSISLDKADDAGAKNVDQSNVSPKTGSSASYALLGLSAVCIAGAGVSLMRARKQK